MISANSFGEMCFLESYKDEKKVNFEIFETFFFVLQYKWSFLKVEGQFWSFVLKHQKDFFDSLNELFFKFIWNGGNDRVQRKIVCTDYSHFTVHS